MFLKIYEHNGDNLVVVESFSADHTFFTSLSCIPFLCVQTTCILDGRVVKVAHSTRTAILQLVYFACLAAQEHVETRIWNFHFFVSFSAKLRLGRV